jgi:hypothetical protein
MSRILHLSLNREPFEMIAAGIKLEEYREIKPYWIKRLTVKSCHQLGQLELIPALTKKDSFKKYDVIRFRNGYAKKDPEIDVICNGIHYGIANVDWIGFLTQNWYFCIELGEIISIKNYTIKTTT